MARKKNKHPLLEDLSITDIAAEGKSIGKYNEMVVFVPFAVPGDVVDVQITNKRRRFMEGRVVNYKELSPIRIEAECQHFGVCGGCKWQNLPYPEQLKYKGRQVYDQLVRIGHLELPEISPVLPSEEIYFYRNKLEFTFASKRWMTKEEIDSKEEIDNKGALGFHIPGMFDKVLDIQKCWLQNDLSNDIRNKLREYTQEQGYEYYDARAHTGLMRNIIIRTSTTGEVMAIVVFALPEQDKIDDVMGFLQKSFPSLTSLYYIVNTKLNDSIGDQEPVLFAGKDHILEQMGDLSFIVGPKSFYQTNSAQAYRLYSKAKELARLQPDDIVYDLYTGTGTIANFVARDCSKVVGIEYVPDAIEDAKKNSALNGIGNTIFFAGDMKDILNPEFIGKHGKPDVIITDPPRAGMHEDVVRTIREAAPRRIVYVSCNPATQARDLALLADAYDIEQVCPVDMFPQTHHVENIVSLIRKN